MGSFVELKGLELLKSWGLGDEAALRARAEAVWRESVEARSSFHMQKLSTPLYQEKTSHSLIEVSKKILNISVQHCLQLILYKKAVSVPPYSLGISLGLIEEKEVWSAAVRTVPGPVSERVALCTPHFQCLWSHSFCEQSPAQLPTGSNQFSLTVWVLLVGKCTQRCNTEGKYNF